MRLPLALLACLLSSASCGQASSSPRAMLAHLTAAVQALGIGSACPTGSPADTPAGDPGLPVPGPAQPLAPLDLSDLRLYNWSGQWVASNWPSQGPVPYQFDHIARGRGHAARLLLDNAGAPQLKAGGGDASHTRGLWEVDVTLPQLRDGLVVAPLWLYNEQSKEEVDIEFTGRTGLQLTLHTYPGGVHTQDVCKLHEGEDWSGQRHRLAIRMDEAAGLVEIYVDARRAARFDRGTTKGFPGTPLKPIIEMWAADPNNPGFVSWVGRWTPLPAHDRLEMTVAGYRYADGKAGL